jgi:hypothetical protein
MLVGGFTLFIGILFVVIGALGLKMQSVISPDMKFDKQTTLRMP